MLSDCLALMIDALLFATSIRLYRGAYMSAHVLLNLLNEFGKNKPNILSSFRK